MAVAERLLLDEDAVEELVVARREAERNPAKLSLEWGVRRLDEELELRTKAGKRKPVKADFFPAYDSDGGLLVALTPRGT